MNMKNFLNYLDLQNLFSLLPENRITFIKQSFQQQFLKLIHHIHHFLIGT